MADWRPRILVCDDEPAQRNIVAEILRSASYPTAAAASLDDALRVFNEARESEQPFHLVLTDLKMPADTEGLQLLEAVKTVAPATEVVLMTAFSTVRTAVSAMKQGAFEYLPKPFDKDRLLHVVSQAEEKLSLVQENQRLRRLVDGEQGDDRMVGRSRCMQELYRFIDRVARTDATCLARGESGTGKELVARAVHRRSPRHDQPFLAINCAAIPETLIESELFGHEKGVFTGANAAKKGRFEEVGEGTLFLDEIGSMKYDLQAKLLRVIQEREFSRVGSAKLIPFHGRIVAATAQDLEALIRDNQFREDLYFRLNVVPLEIPPLRDRTGDIPLLVEHFVRRCNERNGFAYTGVTRGVLEAFEAYSWPGNVRELENCIERMMILGSGELLDEAALPPAVQGSGSSVAGRATASVPLSIDAAASAAGGDSGGSAVVDSSEAVALGSSDGWATDFQLPEQGVVMEDIEADLIRQALVRTGGRIEPAAQLLGVTYKTLQYRIKKYGLKQCQDEARTSRS